MKTLWLVSSLVALMSLTPVVAQEDETAGKGQQVPAEGRIQPQNPQALPQRGDVLAPANLARELKLTDEQRARVEGLWKQYNEQNERIRRDTSITQEQRMQRMARNRQEYVRLVRSLLNEEQLKRFEQLIEEQSPALGSLSEMRFTPQQMEKLREITQRYAKLRQEISQDQSLDPAVRSRRLQEIQQQMLNEIREKVLTPQQREIWDKAMKRAQEEQKKDKKEEQPKNPASGNPPQN